ncbi:MAG: hypothetical protein ACRDHW_00175 [Ktedonobacteraceae bacterium]
MLNSPDDFERNEPFPFPGETHALQPIVDKSPIANVARMQVVDDIEDIKALAEREGQVVIVQDDVVKRARTLARTAAKSSNPANHDDYRQLQERYLAAYFALFDEEKKPITKDLKCFPDTKAINLARKARADRKKYTFPSSGKGPFHQRDLAVVSALYELGLCQDLESYLEQIHEYVDTYEEAFRNLKEEVAWPPATF